MDGDFSLRRSAEWLSGPVTADLVASIRTFLTRQGTFEFPRLSTGLFSAAAGEGADFELSGYRSVWVRDNIQIAWAHLAAGLGSSIPVVCVEAIAAFYQRYRQRFVEIIEGRADFREPMNRPHIRFNGADLSELPEKWSHAQNDALGYFLWLACRLMSTGAMVYRQSSWDILSLLLRFWEKIEVWQDEDSGHWEEGPQDFGLESGLCGGWAEGAAGADGAARGCCGFVEGEYGVDVGFVESLLQRCEASLAEILPSECVQSEAGKGRRYDAALLFLIYPLDVVRDRRVEDVILADVDRELRGEHGIRRYLGDSYWCADYRDLLSAEQRTADFSDSLGQRDRLLRPGYEGGNGAFSTRLFPAFGVRDIRLAEQNRICQLSCSRCSVHLGSSRVPGDDFLRGGVLNHGFARVVSGFRTTLRRCCGRRGICCRLWRGWKPAWCCGAPADSRASAGILRGVP
ncbi:MAG UNVERIFIED_CONTAM: glycoside hydrolase family 15 protein [Planctomycetaceae bacterium]|jgi:phosphorylase kinase alpha/beta subunit